MCPKGPATAVERDLVVPRLPVTRQPLPPSEWHVDCDSYARTGLMPRRRAVLCHGGSRSVRDVPLWDVLPPKYVLSTQSIVCH
jgi:hypothetical protein